MNVLRRAWRSQKPTVRSEINWAVAPPSLAVCFPLSEGGGYPMEYVTRRRSPANIVEPGSFGRTEWTPYGIDMLGGGVSGAQGLTIPNAGIRVIDFSRRTTAFRQNGRNIGGNPFVNLTTTVWNGRTGAGVLEVAASLGFGFDPGIFFNVNGTSLTGTARSSLYGIWHSIMASYSSGSGVDARVGMKIWDDGTLVASQGTCGASPDQANQLVGRGNANNASFEYWYEFNEFNDDNGLAAQLHDFPYWFFTAPKQVYFSVPASVTISPPSIPSDEAVGTPTIVLDLPPGDAGGGQTSGLLYYPDTREVEVIDKWTPKSRRSKRRHQR